MDDSTTSTLPTQLAKFNRSARSWPEAMAFLAQRDDPPAELFAAAAGMMGRSDLKELLVVRGTLRALERGEPVPSTVDRFFTGLGVFVPDQPGEAFVGLEELVRALKGLGAERARAILRTMVKSGPWAIYVFPLLHAFADDRELIGEAFRAVGKTGNTAKEVTAGLGLLVDESLAQVAGMFRELPLTADQAVLVHRAVRNDLIRRATEGRSWEARFDAFLNLPTGLEPKLDEDQTRSLGVAVRALDEERLQKWLDVNLATDPVRVLMTISDATVAQVRMAMKAIASRPALVGALNDGIDKMIPSGKRALAMTMRKALAESPIPGLGDSIARLETPVVLLEGPSKSISEIIDLVAITKGRNVETL